jgi:tetratricopeptide (TPR) repeat protein
MDPENAPESTYEPSPEFARALAAANEPATRENAKQLEAAALTAFLEAGRMMEEHPSPDRRLEEELTRQLEAHQWAAAITCYEQLITATTTRGEQGLLMHKQLQLSLLLSALGRPEAALKAARAATAAARRLDRASAVLYIALENEALHLLACDDPAAALACAQEALQKVGPEPIARTSRARLLVLRSRCALALDDLTAVESDLAEAWPLLDPLADSLLLAGVQAGLAGWHEVRAQWHRGRGELPTALEHQRLAVNRRRVVHAAPQLQHHVSVPGLARALNALAQLLEETGEPGEAAEARREGERLLRELDLPA